FCSCTSSSSGSPALGGITIVPSGGETSWRALLFMIGAGDPGGGLTGGWFSPRFAEGPQPASARVIASAPQGAAFPPRASHTPPNVTRARFGKFEHYTGLSFN